MRTIVIGFSKPSKTVKFPIIASLIRFCMGTQYSHTYVKFFSETFNQHLIYEATLAGGVHFVSVKRWITHNQPVKEFTLNISQEQYEKLMRFFIENAGIPYATSQLFLIGVNYMLKLLKLQPIEPKRQSEAMICSEVLARLVHEVLGLQPNKAYDLYEPKDIETILTTYNR